MGKIAFSLFLLGICSGCSVFHEELYDLTQTAKSGKSFEQYQKEENANEENFKEMRSLKNTGFFDKKDLNK